MFLLNEYFYDHLEVFLKYKKNKTNNESLFLLILDILLFEVRDKGYN